MPDDALLRAPQLTRRRSKRRDQAHLRRLREMPATHEELRRKIEAMEKSYDARFSGRFQDQEAGVGNTSSTGKDGSDSTPEERSP
jgi:hypothetical protein